jgi:hypothetical protein
MACRVAVGQRGPSTQLSGQRLRIPLLSSGWYSLGRGCSAGEPWGDAGCAQVDEFAVVAPRGGRCEPCPAIGLGDFGRYVLRSALRDVAAPDPEALADAAERAVFDRALALGRTSERFGDTDRGTVRWPRWCRGAGREELPVDRLWTITLLLRAGRW